MIGIVVPAHNEETHLPACLRSLKRAARHRALAGEEVRIVVVLDACTDGSLDIAAAAGVEVIQTCDRQVGRARALGAERLLAAGARWLACTDADSRVAPDWLAQQLARDTDVVCGTVEVADWHGLGERVRRSYEKLYADREGHGHVHGANLGIAAHAYRAAGGFQPLHAHEDVALVRECLRLGLRIAWTARPRVRTSSRLRGRVAQGFSTFLSGLARSAGVPMARKAGR